MKLKRKPKVVARFNDLKQIINFVNPIIIKENKKNLVKK